MIRYPRRRTLLLPAFALMVAGCASRPAPPPEPAPLPPGLARRAAAFAERVAGLERRPGRLRRPRRCVPPGRCGRGREDRRGVTAVAVGPAGSCRAGSPRAGDRRRGRRQDRATPQRLDRGELLLDPPLVVQHQLGQAGDLLRVADAQARERPTAHRRPRGQPSGHPSRGNGAGGDGRRKPARGGVHVRTAQLGAGGDRRVPGHPDRGLTEQAGGRGHVGQRLRVCRDVRRAGRREFAEQVGRRLAPFAPGRRSLEEGRVGGERRVGAPRDASRARGDGCRRRPGTVRRERGARRVDPVGCRAGCRLGDRGREPQRLRAGSDDVESGRGGHVAERGDRLGEGLGARRHRVSPRVSGWVWSGRVGSGWLRSGWG